MFSAVNGRIASISKKFTRVSRRIQCKVKTNLSKIVLQSKRIGRQSQSMLYLQCSQVQCKIYPCFNAHSVQCKHTLYALFPSKILLLTEERSEEKGAWNSCILKILLNGYILDVGTVLYMAGSLWFRRIKQSCFNAQSLQRKRTLYALFPCKIMFLIVEYSVDNASWNSSILNI